MNWLQIRNAVAGLGLMVAVPVVASAATLTYTPSGASDLNDLDHHMIYTWQLTDNALKTQTVTGASLTFSNLYNWDGTANRLFMYLLNSANVPGTLINGQKVQGLDGTTNACANANNCVSQFKDDPTNTSPAPILDDFASTRYTSAPGWIVPVVGGVNAAYKLADHSFAGPGQSPTSAPGGAFNGDWTITQGSSSTLWNYTYKFTTGDLYYLNSYITDGTFALGLDPDCHYFNTDITLKLYTTPGTTGGSTVPEPASMLLVGTGVALAIARRFRKSNQ